MIRDFLTVTIVSLSLFGSVSQQEGGSFGLRLLAATGDSRRSLAQFLDLYAGLKAGASQALAAQQGAGWSEMSAES
ncbi:MAG: hypothetical protein KDK53_13610 [Maritimibacter sp.]|nr:hypothetical protein [Maritimibacter sp.]